MNILFMCVANSARSQLAEGLGRKFLGADTVVQSAGSRPTSVNPFAIAVMKEIGIDISGYHSKTCDELSPNFLAGLNYVVTLCAEEVCPFLKSKATKLHWPFTDPAGKEGDEATQLARFRQTRDGIAEKIRELSKKTG